MKRLLMMCALAGFVMACGDDDGDGTKPPVDGGGIDSGAKDGGGTDSGVAPDAGPAAVKVTNVGTACTVANQSTACMGTMPVCQVETSIKPAFPVPGGSCSAVCSTNAECGPGGACPTGIAIKAYGSATAASLGTVGYCNKACVKGASTCGTGFICTSLYELDQQPSGSKLAPNMTPFSDYFCFPTPPTAGDAGVGDAGIVSSVDGGLDAGH